ncbi:MAG: hypothetical protein GTO13_22605 [Proteobacteria bacterium]|nr:hypothetical protein [Pseudomonadota bacterium]
MALEVLVLTILLPLNALFLRHKPEELGLDPDGIGERGSPKREKLEMMDHTWPESNCTLKRALPPRRSWALMIFSFFAVIPVHIVIIHRVHFLVDRGIDKTTAAFILAVSLTTLS